MTRWLFILTLLVFIAAMAAAALTEKVDRRAVHHPIVAAPAPSPQAQRPAPLPSPLVGFTLNLHHNDDHALYRQAVTDLADMGFNAVQFTVPVFQTDGQANDIRIETGPARGPRADRLIDLIALARRRGMTVMLAPIVLFTHPRGDEWRGKLSPLDWDQWWTGYERISAFFLDIAIEHDVQVYVIGSELLTTERQSQRWRSLIASARQRFNGHLTYASHWDRYDVPAFWDSLDFVGVNDYFDMTDGRGALADQAALNAACSRRRDQLLTFAARVGKPLLLTEVGFPSLPWAVERPWKYTHDGAPADHDAQAAGYSALLHAWGPLLANAPKRALADPSASGRTTNPPAFAGVMFYEWDPYRRGESTDTHYGIRGKPAESLLRELLEGRK